jgi:hypothetical protein
MPNEKDKHKKVTKVTYDEDGQEKAPIEVSSSKMTKIGMADMLKCPRCGNRLKRTLNWTVYRYTTPCAGVYQFDCNCFDRMVRITIN